MKVLVIDDDKLHRLVIGRMAYRASYGINYAASTAEALACFGKGTPHCVTLDLDLGLTRGTNLIGEISRLSPLAYVIVISGADETARQFALDQLAANNIWALDIPKPIDMLLLHNWFCILATRSPSMRPAKSLFGDTSTRTLRL